MPPDDRPTRSGPDIRLGITEWNTTAGDWGLGRAMLWTLDNASVCSRYHNFMHRHCDLIEIANRSNLADSFCSGIIQTNNHGLFKTPTYYAQQLYATHAGTVPLHVAVDSVLPGDPALDAIPPCSADGRTVAVFVVSHTTAPQPRTLDLTRRGGGPARLRCGRWPTRPKPANATRRIRGREPDRIRPVPGHATLTQGKLSYRFPALSLSVIKVRRSEAAANQNGTESGIRANTNSRPNQAD